MAFDFVNNLFLSEEKKQKITHIMSLMAVISADGKVADEEASLLRAIAEREGLTDKEYSDILDGKKRNVKPTIPKNDEQKIQYLKDATAMMLIDGNLNPEELKLCVAIGKRLGLSAEKVSEIITDIVAKYTVNKMKQDLLSKQQSDKPVEVDKGVAFDKQS
ncbi:MAG: TerB family tellurite resistance protein, partial [Prevotella sp.]|nr:TerB family tellurite resistance protein [Prevotella sp.]